MLNRLVQVLIYSDPIDDGFVRGKVFPDGPWRPKFGSAVTASIDFQRRITGVERGSVAYGTICSGDPTRTKECLDDPSQGYIGTLIPSIPVQPLSWGDAEPLLQALTGTVAPATWQG